MAHCISFCRRLCVSGWLALLISPSGLLAASPSPATASSVEQWVNCLKANLPQRSVLTLKARTFDARGEVSSRSLTLYSQRSEARQQATVQITAPHDLAGTAYLLQKHNGQELTLSYLPALGRVQRISGEGNGPLLDTAISTSDVRHVLNGFADGSLLIGKAGQVNDWPTRRIFITAPPGESSDYDKIELEVADPQCVVVEARFYARNRLLKTITAAPGSLVRQGAYHYARKLKVVAPKDPLYTELEITGYQADIEIDSSRFDPHSFFRGR